jgi:protein gp37
MGTKIEWCDITVNPIRVKGGGWHCTKISLGCKNCYAEKLNKRFGNGRHYDKRKVEYVLDLSCFKKLPKTKSKRIFVQSMGDLFHEDVSFEFIDQVMRMFAMRPQHIFKILTKRPERMKKYFYDIANNRPGVIDRILKTDDYPKMHEQILRLRRGECFGNLYLGVSVENQEAFDERWKYLKQIQSKVLWISYEPALGPLVLPDDFLVLGNRAWVVVGGESSPGARPMNPGWASSLRDQCVAAGVPIFIKQLHINGKLSKDPAEWPEDLRIRELPNV